MEVFSFASMIRCNVDNRRKVPWYVKRVFIFVHDLVRIKDMSVCNSTKYVHEIVCCTRMSQVV